MSIRLPAEWETQSAVLIIWPHEDTDWRPYLEQVTKTYLEIARAILARQKLVVCFHNELLKKATLELFSLQNISTTNLICFIAPNNDTWARDSGPITVYDNNEPVLLDFIFNAWGGKFQSDLDNQITTEFTKAILTKRTDISTNQINMILEGGSIESDGQGTLLTTSKCLLTDTRNTMMSKNDIENQLIKNFNLKRVLWLKYGYMLGDDTDSHIDILARFCPNDAIAYCACNDEDDPHYDELTKMETELKQLRTIKGKPYKLAPLPLPQAIYSENGTRLPATYANFLIINKAILLPIYGDNNADKFAIKQLNSIFPEREIIAINCKSLIKQFGSLHCVTMQLPQGVVK
ncbi:MAG: agmatine deiminase family protein [Gammaproteobacteria bacterium]|nr:MAG: agmatine deiminase family protein [Gammaproteobacteria bacterium]